MHRHRKHPLIGAEPASGGPMGFSSIEFEGHHYFASLPLFLIRPRIPIHLSLTICFVARVYPAELPFPATLDSSCTNTSPLPRETGLQASLYEPRKEVSRRPLLYMVSSGTGETGCRGRDRERDEKVEREAGRGASSRGRSGWSKGLEGWWVVMLTSGSRLDFSRDLEASNWELYR